MRLKAIMLLCSWTINTSLKPLESVYGEVGVGILNIFKLIKLYGFMRLTQTDEPNVAKFGFKFHISPSL